jgi:hypothetical protein
MTSTGQLESCNGLYVSDVYVWKACGKVGEIVYLGKKNQAGKVRSQRSDSGRTNPESRCVIIYSSHTLALFK